MAPFDPKMTLEQIAPSLRRELFAKRDGFEGLDWDTVKKRRQVGPLFDRLHLRGLARHVVMRRSSPRYFVSSNGVPRCMVARLSQIARSPVRQRCR